LMNITRLQAEGKWFYFERGGNFFSLAIMGRGICISWKGSMERWLEMTKWRKARKKPVVIEYRDVIATTTDPRGRMAEKILTREGALYGYPDVDVIIKGVEGELYPCKKDIFEKTYEKIDAEGNPRR